MVQEEEGSGTRGCSGSHSVRSGWTCYKGRRLDGRSDGSGSGRTRDAGVGVTCTEGHRDTETSIPIQRLREQWLLRRHPLPLPSVEPEGSSTVHSNRRRGSLSGAVPEGSKDSHELSTVERGPEGIPGQVVDALRNSWTQTWEEEPCGPHRR